MTVGDQRTISTLSVAKALHPAGWNRPREPGPDEPAEGAGPPTTSTDSAGSAQTVLWQEDACRARLRSATQGWLSLPGRAERVPVIIATVEGDDVVLVARPTWGLGDGTAELAGRLAIGGVTPELRRWVVRVHGPVQLVVAEDPTPAGGDLLGRAHPGTGAHDPEELLVLALTVTRLRGFESGGRPEGG